MAQNITTVLDKAAIEAADLSLSDILYLIHGTGSDRDRKLTLQALRDWLQEHLGNTTIDGTLTLSGQNGTTTLTNLLMSIVDSDNYKVDVGPDSITFSQVGGTTSATLTKTGLTVNGSGGSVTITNGALSIAKDGVVYSFGMNGLFASKVSAGQFCAESIVSSSSDYSALPQQELQSGNHVVGDVVLVHNTGATNIKVYISMPSGASATYVSLNPGCCVAFVCVSAASANFYSEWAPMSNMQIYSTGSN